jgi:hypothetical protein
MFLTPRNASGSSSGRRERTDHGSLEEAQATYAQHPRRAEFEALIYIDGNPAWLGTIDWHGRVQWQPWKV